MIPRTVNQARVVASLRDNDLCVITGPAGTGKTHLAIAYAVEAIAEKKFQRLILTRPQITAAGESMGFLPGDINRKMLPWLLPIHDVLRNISWTKPEEFFKQHVEVVPLGFMRGRTFDKAIAVLDEAQNATYGQLKLFVSRLGHKGKVILTGDPGQSDLTNDQYGFTTFVDNLLSPSPIPTGVSISRLGMEDIVRHPLLQHILERI